MIKGKVTFKSEITEQQFMESMLNQYYSGINVKFVFMINALFQTWHIDKFTYYFNMIGGGEDD